MTKNATDTPNYATVTEVAGEEITREQLLRMCHRYRWAGEYCRNHDVVEVACGSGQGLGYLAGISRTLVAGDILPSFVENAAAHYRDRVRIEVMDAMRLPFKDRSLDVVILFEAIYYLSDVEAFVREAARILRPGGHILITTANKNMTDFNPSPFSHTYYSSTELVGLMHSHGFTSELFGAWTYEIASPLQRLLIPVKKLAVSSGLMPKTMQSKKLLKRLVFGELIPMPNEISPEKEDYVPPEPIETNTPDRVHRVLYCAARKE